MFTKQGKLFVSFGNKTLIEYQIVNLFGAFVAIMNDFSYLCKKIIRIWRITI